MQKIYAISGVLPIASADSTTTLNRSQSDPQSDHSSQRCCAPLLPALKHRRAILLQRGQRLAVVGAALAPFCA
jgi:hypothetical protein